jgi:UPF0755 protein
MAKKTKSNKKTNAKKTALKQSKHLNNAAVVSNVITPAHKKSNKKTKVAKPKTIRGIVVQTVIGFGILIAIALFTALFYASPIASTETFTVKPGASVSVVARDLSARNMVVSAPLLKTTIALFGGKIQQGTYEFKPGRSIWGIARDLSRGRIALAKITIPEGMTVKQIYEMIDCNSDLSGEIRIVFRDGELFPDTYHFAKGYEKNKLLQDMAAKMTALSQKYTKFPEPIENWKQLISLAAIVQKETSKVSEMPIVAGVYLNRLRIGMKLQADPTVVYAITDGYGSMRGRRLYYKHLTNKSFYNTYKYKGLTPAPIANPGLDAIMAALSPKKTDYLYFVADGTGGHIFCETLECHQENVAKWRIIKKEILNKEKANAVRNRDTGKN